MLCFSITLLVAALLLLKSFVRSLNNSSVDDNCGGGRVSDVNNGYVRSEVS